MSTYNTSSSPSPAPLDPGPEKKKVLCYGTRIQPHPYPFDKHPAHAAHAKWLKDHREGRIKLGKSTKDETNSTRITTVGRGVKPLVLSSAAHCNNLPQPPLSPSLPDSHCFDDPDCPSYQEYVPPDGEWWFSVSPRFHKKMPSSFNAFPGHGEAGDVQAVQETSLPPDSPTCFHYPGSKGSIPESTRV